MGKLSATAWIGNAAAVLTGKWGSVTQRAQEAGCSRQTVYEHANRVAQAVTEQTRGGPSRQQQQQEIERLQQENKELWEAFSDSVVFDEKKQQEFTVKASAMGLSLSQILVLMAVILPSTRQVSRATLGRWLAYWSERAGKMLKVLDGKCKELVCVMCIDEIFFGRLPVLVGVEPQSMAWVIGHKAGDRKGETWYEALRPWERVEYVVADAGTGLQKGLILVRESRSQQAQEQETATQASDPPLRLEVGLDVFHTKKEAGPVLRRMWQRAEALWEKAEALDREVARRRQQGKDARGAACRARWAWERAEQAFEEADRVDAAWQRCEQALSVFRPDGSLNDRAWAEAEIEAAMKELSGSEWKKVCRLLTNPCTFTFLDRLHRLLDEAVSAVELPEGVSPAEFREAFTRLWWLRRQRTLEERSAGDEASPSGLVHAAYVVQARVCQKLDANWRETYRRVAYVLMRTVRASSVVECMNSVIRMHQARHRTLTQPLLNLKRLAWNCRAFREGKRRRHCPYEHLGLVLPTYDFWELLQMAPEDLLQKVSTATLAV